MDVGTCKPALGLCPAAQAAFVEHRASELAGARAIGMQTIAYKCNNDAGPDYFIEKSSSLLKLSVLD